MRITFVLPDANLGGGTRVIAIYADRLRRRGHQVVVVSTPIQLPSLAGRIKSLLKGQGWPTANPGRSHLDEFEIDHRVIDSYRPVTNRDVPNADVIIATWWETAEWVAQLSPSKGAKAYLIQDHEIFPYLPIKRAAATWRLPLHKIVVSQWLADLARTEYGDPHVSLVPNAVDHRLFWAPSRKKQSVPTVGLLYSTALRKACIVALQAFILASEHFPELRLVAFGAAEPVPKLPLPQRVEFHLRPPQAKLRELYAQCDAWLFSSRTEGFGLPILEAMACRTPVIATPAGAAPQLLTDGGGILVAPEDVNDMARAIERVVTLSQAEWSRLSDCAFATAMRHNWDDATVLFEKALETAVARSG